jgi:hypothetical protein
MRATSVRIWPWAGLLFLPFPAQAVVIPLEIIDSEHAEKGFWTLAVVLAFLIGVALGVWFYRRLNHG